MKTQTRFGLFVVVALLQLLFPAKLVFESNKVLWWGTALKFKTEPIDPADPFRGRYVALNFAAREFTASTGHPWKRGDAVYVILENDAQGYVQIQSLHKTRPSAAEGIFVKAQVRYVRKNRITLDYPFRKFFMEEHLAPKADAYYRQQGEGHALVKVYKGEAVLEDVVVKGKSLRTLR